MGEHRHTELEGNDRLVELAPGKLERALADYIHRAYWPKVVARGGAPESVPPGIPEEHKIKVRPENKIGWGGLMTPKRQRRKRRQKYRKMRERALEVERPILGDVWQRTAAQYFGPSPLLEYFMDNEQNIDGGDQIRIPLHKGDKNG